jgi:hypothetical protein
LDAWFIDNVEGATDGSGRLKNIWYAVVTDIALWLGDLTIAENPGLYWDFCSWGGKHYMNYQMAVIVGFDKMPVRWEVEYRGAIAPYGVRRVAGGDVEEPLFNRMLDASASDARGDLEQYR